MKSKLFSIVWCKTWDKGHFFGIKTDDFHHLAKKEKRTKATQKGKQRKLVGISKWDGPYYPGEENWKTLVVVMKNLLYELI